MVIAETYFKFIVCQLSQLFMFTCFLFQSAEFVSKLKAFDLHMLTHATESHSKTRLRVITNLEPTMGRSIFNAIKHLRDFKSNHAKYVRIRTRLRVLIWHLFMQVFSPTIFVHHFTLVSSPTIFVQELYATQYNIEQERFARARAQRDAANDIQFTAEMATKEAKATKADLKVQHAREQQAQAQERHDKAPAVEPSPAKRYKASSIFVAQEAEESQERD